MDKKEPKNGNPTADAGHGGAALAAENEALKIEVAELRDTVRQLQKMLFGKRSERRRYIVGENQLMLFDEAELAAMFPEEEPVQLELEPAPVKAHARKPKRTKAELSKLLPVVKNIVRKQPGENCGICESELHLIGLEYVRSEVNIVPEQAFVEETYVEVYGCAPCHEETDEANIIKAQAPVPVVKKGLASPSSVAYTMYQKYANAMPLYRQEKSWGNFGVGLSRGTLANWIIHVSEHWLRPLWESWKKELLAASLILADETVTQVLKEPGKTPQSESRMWVYATGARAGPRKIVLFEYCPDRAGHNPRAFLEGAAGPFYLHTDGYAGYNNIPGATNCGCFAHLRRKFNDAMPKSPPEDNPAYVGFMFCQKLFHLEGQFDKEGLTPAERHAARLEKSKPVVDGFFSWVKKLNVLSSSKLAKAVTYALNQEASLRVFLEDGHIDISTNQIENAIRPFALGRKNWLFSDSVNGAVASSTAYSVIETAKANGLNPYDYLLYLFSVLPAVLTENPNADLSSYAPWADDIPSKLELTKSRLHSSFLAAELDSLSSG